MKTNNNYFNIGRRIHELRTERKLSQEQLALRSNITTAYLGLIERNLKNPTMKVVEQLCNALNVSLSDFFSDINTPPQRSDTCSLQILSQLNDCTEEEKKIILRIIKDIIRLQRINKQKD